MARFRITMNNMGHIKGWPVNQTYATKISNHMFEWTGNAAASFYIQPDFEVEQFIQDFVPKSKQKDLDNGWDIHINADLWTIAHYYGWDCHTIFE